MRDRLVTVLLVFGFSVGIVALVWGIPASIMENRAEATEKSSLEARVYDLEARVDGLEQRSLPPITDNGADLSAHVNDFNLYCTLWPAPDGGTGTVLDCIRVR